MTVVWAKRVMAHFDEIGDHLARDSPEAAERVVTQLIDVGESLQSGPWRGRRVPESERDDVRELVLGRYRLVYQVMPDLLRILSVTHGARLPTSSRLASA